MLSQLSREDSHQKSPFAVGPMWHKGQHVASPRFFDELALLGIKRLLLMLSAESVHNLLQMGGSNLIIWNISGSLGLVESRHPPNVFSSWLERNADYVRAWHGRNVR